MDAEPTRQTMIAVRVDPKFRSKIKSLAAECDISLQDLVVQLLTKWYESEAER